ncbi:FAD/NAD(P)-binding domain-containing protein [Coemansia reversa NRRL 1564]|uniref:FAD/NAD(P)-binding domain-containing protein n=1 Tax=Coemansia reversa (strain ATCC 12441 / NRRL 1564) TaxID=763665 RepID=A0A2G5B2P8_COERN|nr:FAD/NAD(P)-binding domain-containing protein [Coemansia reversa NRRL 1564]|eukprot:PIA13290.1 FAD/NAD(P)-binding domain-containing protein [Coemansia reversa NRRL 1564]
MAERELDGQSFDVVVLGTGLEEAIIASEAAAGGKSVLHIDRNPYYGGAYACFTLSALIEWAVCHRDYRQVPIVEILVNSEGEKQQQKLTDQPTFVIDKNSREIAAAFIAESPAASRASEALHRLAPFATNNTCTEKTDSATTTLLAFLQNDRNYQIELAPKVALCRGRMIDLLIDSGIGEYVQFRGVEHNYLVRDNGVERVPESKEDIFACTTLSLIEKRKLMRVITSVADNEQSRRIVEETGNILFDKLLREKFKLDGKLLDAVLRCVARVGMNENVNAAEGCERIQRYVSSMGRYGRMAYLCGLYGAGSEITQSFCRMCAVSGGTYILSKNVSVQPANDNGGFTISLGSATVQAEKVVMDPTYASTVTSGIVLSRAICILDAPVLGDDTTALATYVDNGGVVSLLYVTQATMAVPKGKSMLYAWVEGGLSENKNLLCHAISATCGTAIPLITLFMETHLLKASSSATADIYFTNGPDATVDLDNAAVAANNIIELLLK